MTSFLDSYFKTIKRLFPQNIHNSMVGVDIGASSCKAVEVSLKKDGVELINWAVEPIAAADEKSALESLQKVLSGFGLQTKSRTVNAAVSGKGTLVRYVDMPRMSPADLRRAFAIEADKYFPFPKDTVYTDSYILDTIEGGRKLSVLVAAVKKELVDGRLKLLKEAGIDPLSISLDSVALANAFSVFPPDGFSGRSGLKEYKACAVVNIGDAGTNLMIIFSGAPRFNRDIYIGVQEMNKRVANILAVTPAEARVLLSQGAALKESAQKGVEEVMAGLISEIRLSFDYFITEKNLAVTQIFLTGEGALVQGVEKAFKEGIDMPVSIWNPFEKMAMSDTVSKEGLKLNSARLVTALGLAINEYDQA